MTSETTLKQAIAAYKGGRRAEARLMLEQILAQDRMDEGAWLWLSAVVDSDKERAACLEHVLVVNADNVAARRGLERLRARGLAALPSTESAPGAASVVPVSQASEAQAHRSSSTPVLQVAIVLAVGLAAAIVAYVVVSSMELSLPDISRFTSGQKNTPPPIAWQPFTSGAGGFTISMPDEQKSDVLPMNTPVGVIDLHLFTVDLDDSAYIVGYSDYPESLVRNSSADVMLDGARDGAVANVGGKLLNERRLTLQGYPGRELWIEAEAGGQPGLVQARIYLVGRRLYQVLVAGSTTQFSESDAEFFLDSFELR